MIEEIALNELRQPMGITQERSSKALRINQAGVSKIDFADLAIEHLTWELLHTS